jgi:hypothetical protein
MQDQKVQIAICLKFEQVELLSEIRSKYHLKNLSAAVDVVIRQWQMFLEQKQREQIAKNPVRKPVNPMVNP